MSGRLSVIWKGIVEWEEKLKSPTATGIERAYWPIPCKVAASVKDDVSPVKTESWPAKLKMKLMPKILIARMGQDYLRNSESVIFHSSPCAILDKLTRMLTSGFAGLVYFAPGCDAKMMLLLYVAEKRAFIGFIPNDQQDCIDKLKLAIKQYKAEVIAAAARSEQQLAAASKPEERTTPKKQVVENGGEAMQINNNIVLTSDEEKLTDDKKREEDAKYDLKYLPDDVSKMKIESA